MADKDNTELRMNLVAVKKVDPYAKDIIDTSSHVAYYTFNSEGNEWEKTNVEGALFVYSRVAEPYHNIFVNNRLNTRSLVEPITSEIEIQSQPPFLLYRNRLKKIRGFWFYNLAECDRISELVGKLVENCKKDKMDHQNNSSISNNVNNIFSMLSKAQEDFYKSGGGGGVAGSQPIPQFNNNNDTSMINNNNNSSSNNNSSTNNQPDVTSSVMNFFAAAKPNPPEVPIFQRMFSNPMSVEQIEKQQRASSPQAAVDKTVNVSSSPPSKLPETTHHHENGIRFTRINSPSNHEFGTSPLATFLNGAKLPITKTNLPPPSNQQVQQLSQDLSGLFRKMSDTLNTSNSLQSPGKPTLLLPNMLVSPSTGINNNQVNLNNPGSLQLVKSLSNSNVINNGNIISNKSGQSQMLVTHPSTSSTSALLTQQGLHQSTTSSIGTSHNTVMNAPNSIHHHHRFDNNNSMNSTKPEPLTKSQLLQAMNYLIKNDPDFIKKLHEAYLKSFTEMVSL